VDSQLSNVMVAKPGASKSKPGDESETPGMENQPKKKMSFSKEPGEGYVISMTIIGMVLGSAIGYFIGFPLAGIFLGILCVLGGAILGSVVGNFLGARMKDLKVERDKEKKRR
jgi:membrane protein YqaA with SNARE-associated domain